MKTLKFLLIPVLSVFCVFSSGAQTKQSLASPDGNIKVSIAGGPASTITVKDHRLVTVKKSPDKYRALMEFGSMQLAHDLFDGKVNAIAKVGEGEIVMRGMINMIDNVNRILDRVALYLA